MVVRQAILFATGLGVGAVVAAASRLPKPLFAILAAVLFVVVGLAFENPAIATLVAIFVSVVLACAIVDARRRIIPNNLVYPSLLLLGTGIVVLAVADEGVSPMGAAAGLLAYGGGMFVVAIVSPRAMGMGDVKLAALIGLVLGALGTRYLTVGALTGLLAGGIGGALALVRGGSAHQTIPFGPYLAGGAILSALAAPHIAA